MESESGLTTKGFHKVIMIHHLNFFLVNLDPKKFLREFRALLNKVLVFLDKGLLIYKYPRSYELKQLASNDDIESDPIRIRFRCIPHARLLAVTHGYVCYLDE